MESLSKYKRYEVGYTELAFQKKVTVLKKYLLLKKQEVPASNKYMFRIIIPKK